MEGIQLLVNYLKENNTDHSKRILEKLYIVATPCINVVGNLVNERNCPPKGSEVEIDNGKIINFNNSNIPNDWSDPNRGWDSNNTLCKDHLVEFLKEKPVFSIFNHDWMSQYGTIYGYCSKEDLKITDDIDELFHEYYPKMVDLNGDQVKFKFSFDERKDSILVNDEERVTLDILYQKHRINSILIENFIFHQNAAECHFALTLFFLSKLAGIIDDLPKKVLNQVHDFMKTQNISKRYIEEENMIIIPKTIQHYGFLTKK